MRTHYDYQFQIHHEIAGRADALCRYLGCSRSELMNELIRDKLKECEGIPYTKNQNFNLDIRGLTAVDNSVSSGPTLDAFFAD